MRGGAAVAAAGMAALALAACSSSPRTYSNSLPKNMHVTKQVEGGSVRVAVGFDIHGLKADCDLDFQGRVELEDGTTDIGLPVDRPLLLDFIFVTRGGFGSTTGATRHGMVITPRSGYDYRALVSYAKGIYSVEIREARKGVSGGRVLERVPLSACKAKT
jgi:hypothetical protein